MLFDRRAKRSDSQHRDARAEYRSPLPPDHPLRMLIVRADGEELEVLPVDLTARGAGFRTWPDVSLNEDEVFEVVLWSEADGWTVRTPGVARHGSSDDDAVDWGVEFVNLGNLYGQWEDVLGRYFNRRSHPRVSPELDRQIAAKVSWDGQKASATLHDLSTGGIGLVLRHAEAGGIRRGARLQVAFSLPRSRRTLAGAAVVRQVRRAGAQDFVGVELDLSDPEGFALHQRPIAAYCEKRAKAVSEWEKAWQGSAA